MVPVSGCISRDIHGAGLCNSVVRTQLLVFAVFSSGTIMQLESPAKHRASRPMSIINFPAALMAPKQGRQEQELNLLALKHVDMVQVCFELHICT